MFWFEVTWKETTILVNAKFFENVRNNVMFENNSHSSELTVQLTFTFIFQKLLEPFTYITQLPGKNFRGKLSRAFNYWLNIPSEKLEVIEEIIKMLHNASLLWAISFFYK